LTRDLTRLLELPSNELAFLISAFDIKRLEAYSNNMLDYHVILDLLPTLSTLYFNKRFVAPKADGDEDPEESLKSRTVKLSAIQQAMILALGLQRKTMEETADELELSVSQLLAQFAQIIKKMCAVLQLIQRSSVVSEMPQISKLSVEDINGDGGEALERMDLELKEAAEQAKRELRAQADDEDEEMADGADTEKKARQREFINSLDLSQ
jgi:N-acetyltransferase 10